MYILEENTGAVTLIALSQYENVQASLAFVIHGKFHESHTSS